MNQSQEYKKEIKNMNESEKDAWKSCGSARVVDELGGNPIHKCSLCEHYNEYEILNNISSLEETVKEMKSKG